MTLLVHHLRRLLCPRDKWKLLGLSGLMAISALLELAGIGLLVAAVSIFFSPGAAPSLRMHHFLAALCPGITPVGELVLSLTAVLLVIVGKNLFAGFVVFLQSSFITAVERDLTVRLYRLYLCGDYRFLHRLSPDESNGELMRIQRVCEAFLLPLMQLLADTLMLAVLTATVVAVLPPLALPGLVLLLLCAWGVTMLTKRGNRLLGGRRLAAEKEENRLRLSGVLAVKNIKASACEDFFIREYAAVQSRLSWFLARIYTMGQIPRLTLEVLAVLMALAVFGALVGTGAGKHEVLFTFTVLVAAMSRILPALTRSHYELTLMIQHRPMFDSMMSDLQNIPLEQGGSGPVADAGGGIRFQNVSFSHDGGKMIFSGLDLTIPAGSTAVIRGSSGRGKTTLVDLLLGLLRPESGEITAGGRSIAGNLPGWRRQIGYVQQSNFFPDGTVAENVAFGFDAGSADMSRVTAALTAAGLPELSPGQRLTNDAGNLSGGQRQRLAIARALYREPKLLVLDEATAALDRESAGRVIAALEALHGRMTIVIITHQETIPVCDQIINL